VQQARTGYFCIVKLIKRPDIQKNQKPRKTTQIQLSSKKPKSNCPKAKHPNPKNQVQDLEQHPLEQQKAFRHKPGDFTGFFGFITYLLL
jgi:hypothetical protein